MTSTPLPPSPPTYDPPLEQAALPPGPAPRPPLRRSRTNKVIGGVSGGLAEYSGVDALLWRVGFIATTLTWGVGLLVYLLLWLLMPAGPVDPAAEAARAEREPAGPRSPVPGITVAALLILVGIGALVTRFTAVDLGARYFLGGALLIVGVGLAAAAVTGAGRGAKGGLIALGVVLGLAALAATTAGSFDRHVGGTDDLTYRPASAAAVQPRYDSGVGNVTVDLTAVDMSTLTSPVTTEISSGLGDVRVIVPTSADVQVSAQSGIGDVQVFDGTVVGGYFAGTGPASWTGDGRAEFLITVNSGAGDVAVSRG